MKKCPFCAEDIQVKAIKCRHCGEFLKKVPAAKKTSTRKEKIQVKDYAPQETCWFCEKRPGKKNYEAKIEMYGHVRVEDMKTNITGYTYNHRFNTLNIPVPRCEKCSSVHNVRSCLKGLVAGLPALGWAVWIIYDSHSGWFGAICAALIGGLVIFGVCYFVGFLLSRLLTSWSTPDESYGKEYPQVNSLLSQGWKIGSKPMPGDMS